MTDPNLVVLYVADPAASAAFYAELLGRQPADSSPGFALFAGGTGPQLGLWSRNAVAPVAAGRGGGGEIVFTVADAAAVDTTHADWVRRGVAIHQPPTDMPFGRNFLAVDPDGHRLRVLAPA